MEQETNPYTLARMAAQGNLEAQRTLALLSRNMVLQGNSLPLEEGLVFARLAAAHGHNEDRGLLIQMLGLSVSHAVGEADETTRIAEALALVSIAADHGDENAATWLCSLVGEASAESVAESKEVRALMLAGMGRDK
ncbi:MAG: hypothetical protein COW16_08765 [Sphingomonadales bacterium CG12_big_fil_rev_8_21_14_0_65_65_10]|nr:MAG: hypothetical protein COW16_08765 [Sphingomonadales bacterium CG12_big_fil_rev_8_21_14_0_65_65_10]